MTESLKVAIEVAAFSFILTYVAVKVNKPYPWNTPWLDYVEGLGVLTFIPAFLYALGRGIWAI